MRDDKLRELQNIARMINSPLTIMDIGLLIEYNQTGAEHFFEDYMLIQNIWGILNGRACTMENLSILIEKKEVSELESLLLLLNKILY